MINVDLGEVAQGMLGDQVHFKAASTEQAHEALRQQEHAIDGLKALVRLPRTSRKFRMRLGGVSYKVNLELATSVSAREGPKAMGKVSLETAGGETYSYEVDAEARKEGQQ